MTTGTGLFFLAIGFVAGCYFLACGLEHLGHGIRKGLRHIARMEDDE